MIDRNFADQTIWKFPLCVTDAQTVEMPERANLLHADMQDGALTVWALVDPTTPKVRRVIYVRGTGQPCGIAINPVS